jgi:hypothetical protein
MPKRKRKYKNSFGLSLKQQPWNVIVWLTVLGLLLPIATALGLTQGLNVFIVPSVWFGVRCIWVLVVAFRWAANPVWMLTIAGGIYGILTVISQQVHWEDNTDVRFPEAAAVIIANLAAGAFFGLCAKYIQQLRTHQ